MDSHRCDVSVKQIPGWERYSWLRHGFSSRSGGVSDVYGGSDLNLGFTKDDVATAVCENRGRFAHAVSGKSGVPIIAVHQVHGAVVHVLAEGDQQVRDVESRAVLEADGLMTSVPEILLGIQVADCVPVLVCDTRLRVVAAFHAGWRGTVAGIVERGVAQLCAVFGSAAEDLIGAVGPSIGGCCYAVGQEVDDAFHQTFAYADQLFDRRESGLYLDLAKANQRQLLAAGLMPGAVTVVGECTACSRLADGSRKYFSHRAEAGFTGRAMGVIGVAAA